MLTFSDTEEKAVEKAIAALADMIPLEAVQLPHSPALTFPGLEIRLHQRRVLKNGIDVSLTRLEYGALCYLTASYKGRNEYIDRLCRFPLDAKPDLVKRIGNTTFDIHIHFSETSRETFTDKVVRLIENDKDSVTD